MSQGDGIVLATIFSDLIRIDQATASGLPELSATPSARSHRSAQPAGSDSTRRRLRVAVAVLGCCTRRLSIARFSVIRWLTVQRFAAGSGPGCSLRSSACKIRPDCRFPSLTWSCALDASAGIGPHRVPLWSGLVVSARRACDLGPVRVSSVPEVNDLIWVTSLVPVYGYAPLRPPKCLLKVLGLLFPNSHLSVSRQGGDVTPFGDTRLADTVHLRIVLPTHLVIFIERGRECVTGSVQSGF